MKSIMQTVTVKTKGHADVCDLTPRVREAVRAAGALEALVTVFVPGSTAGVTTIEYEPGVVEDLKRACERWAPEGIHYDHDARWGDGNGFSHVRASLLGPSLSIPVAGGEVLLGTWQQVVLVDFDNRPRTREVILQVLAA
jgi:secondary thiamine-phosphate synthase enzyme